jgi:class 3 adenylate cyclase
MEPTAIGDTINVASRIESLCKTLGKSLGSGILLSETTYNAAKVMQIGEGKNPFEFVPAAETEVRGRREALQLFAICQRPEPVG